MLAVAVVLLQRRQKKVVFAAVVVTVCYVTGEPPDRGRKLGLGFKRI